MSLLDEARDARIVAPDEHSLTKFEAFVQISPEARDALVELADAAQEFRRVAIWHDSHVRGVIAALERLQR